jgi:hypothetical protein
VVDEHQIILAADVTIGTRDQGQLQPLIMAARDALDGIGAPAPEAVLADAGYWSASDIRALDRDGVTVLVPPDAHTRTEPAPHRRGGLYEQMRRRLKSDSGRALYQRRMTMIEPVFGQTKHNRRADRFQRRGHPAVRSEWRLITATHNLLKLWRATAAPIAA